MNILQRSQPALRAASVFYQGFNDVDVYIEDTAMGYRKLFLILLQRLVNGSVGISQIFPLGGRIEVIEEARRIANSGGRPSVFIVDGDLFLLAGEKSQLPDNIIVLPRYCIENMLLDQNAIVDFLDDEDGVLRHEDLSVRLDFARWRSEMEECFRELFVLFAISHHLGLGQKTVSLGIKEFIAKDGSQEVDKEKVCIFVDSFKSEIVGKVGEEEYLRVRLLVEQNINSDKCFVSTYVSAKDFLMPILFFKMRKIVKIRADNLNIKMRLAKKCHLEELFLIKNKIHQQTMTVNV